MLVTGNLSVEGNHPRLLTRLAVSYGVKAQLAVKLAGRSDSSLLGSAYLVDPASSHMLVSKIKPCMSKYSRVEVKSHTAH